MHLLTVLAVFFALAAMWGSTNNSSSLFITPIQESLSATRAQMVIGVTVKGLGTIIGSFFCARILQKIQLMRVMWISGLLLTGSIFVLSFVQSIPQYYAVLALQAIITSIGGYIPLSMIIRNWFEKNTSVVMGFAFMGSGFGGMVYNFLGGIWIPGLGWRRTYVIFGFITLAVLIIAFSILRSTPYHFNLRPLGAGEADDVQNEPVEQELPVGAEIKSEIKSSRFWLLLAAVFLTAMITNELFNNLPPHMIDSGYSLTQAARISSATMIFLMLGKPVIGYMFEVFGLKGASIICTLSMALGLISAIFISESFFTFTLITASGIGFAYGSVAHPAYSHRLFGPKNYAVFSSLMQIVSGAGSIISPLVTGFLYSRTKSYIVSFSAALVYCVIAICIWLFVLPKRGREPY
ncbi:MAG: MFS transporter [Clostridiaceae bacterium]|nr:MFS transporter [Clostridiaceae bacterium]